MDQCQSMESNGSSRRANKNGIVKLRCSVKNYDWGLIGRKSGVGRLCNLNSGEEIEDDKPYAEFWMGTHESGPSYVVLPQAAVVSGENGSRAANGNFNGSRTEGEFLTLKAWIEQNPSVLGDKVLERWGPCLPFLFKVLSVAKALSIQAHPDKNLAVRLHKQHPDIYKDENHKPEMALALTEFEALCGFISFEELKAVVMDVPEIAGMVDTACIDQVLQIQLDKGEEAKEALQSLFSYLMSASKDVVAQTVVELRNRLNMKREAGELTEKEELVLRLEKQYPADVGVLAAFLFNHVKLSPGEALYLGANEPHAYIDGECVECMATSDNVVRAGLTPKHRDVQILCSMLTYRQRFPEVLHGVAINPYTVRYLPPFDEFEVDRCLLPKGASAVFPAIPGPSIFIVMTGRGLMITSSSQGVVTEGDVFFAPADTEITLTTSSSLNVYRAGVNSRFL